METMRWIRLVLVLAVIFGAAWWVWERFLVSDETRIRLRMKGMEQAVEQGNLLRLADAIADDYSDDAGMDKSSLLGAVRAFRQQHDGLVIHLSDVAIQVDPDHQKAQAAFVARVVSKPKEGGDESELFTDRFRLFFRKTGQGWQLVRGESPSLKFD
jgi:ketosteroid isomerase-like protein